MKWSEATALMGGTFDPPHLGHRDAVSGLLRFPGVARVRVIPSASPPHKPARARARDRLEMTRLLFAPFAEVEIDAREIERFESTGQPSFTADTLQSLQGEIKSPAFVIGTDQLAELPRWHRFPELLGLSHWIVLQRKPVDPETIRISIAPLEASGLLRSAPSFEGCPVWTVRGTSRSLMLAPTEAPALSSRSIREALGRNGVPPPGSLSPEVESYLKGKRLYGTSGDSHDPR